MGLGVLNTKHNGFVPGTAFVLDVGRTIDTHAPIIRLPRPSSNPNDPLNWPLWKRDLILCVLCFISVIGATTTSLLAANTLTLSLYLGKPFSEVALLTGFDVCGTGVAGCLFVASARKFGKRHLYLLGTVLLLASSVWGGASGHSYKSLLGARILQGVSLAPFEALINATVGDLFFLHERGKRMALSNMTIFGGAFSAPILVGKITHTLGWQWSFYFLAIFSGLALPLVFFLVPETAFTRSDDCNKGISSDHDPVHNLSDSQSTIPSKDSFVKSLSPFNGTKTDENFFKIFFRPFPLFFHPAVVWACLTQGVLVGWSVMMGVVMAAIFIGPPLFFNEVKTGYMYAGPFLGAIIAYVVAGLLADRSTKYMIRKNGGVFEPEFRIVLVIAQFLVGCTGLFGFGVTSNNAAKFGWLWPCFFFGLVIGGMIMGAVASSLYIVDAHRDIAVEAFTCMLIYKNLFSFALTWVANDWLIKDSALHMFILMGCIQVGISVLSIPMYVFGKKNRSFFHRHDLLKMTHLR